LNVWISWCKRQSTCRYCKQFIEVATPCVVCRTWHHKRMYEMRFHTNCWVDNGMDALRQNPYHASPRGRKVLKLEPKDALERKKLLRKHAMLVQQKKRLKAKFPDNLLSVIKLDSKIEDVTTRIGRYGGVPKKWIVQDI